MYPVIFGMLTATIYTQLINENVKYIPLILDRLQQTSPYEKLTINEQPMFGSSFGTIMKLPSYPVAFFVS